MKKRMPCSLWGMMLLLFLTGCSPVGDKTGSTWIIYGVAAILSLLLLFGYCCFVRKKEVWFLLLFVSVLIVNIGYFTLSISGSLEEALLANRIAYLGSVFLPMSMLMIVMNVTAVRYRKWLPGLLVGIGLLVFLVAASPGYLDIYYKEVSFVVVNGSSVLQKVYGPWHSLYLFYLLGYFVVTVWAVVYAAVKKKMETAAHGVILVIAVGVNIGVWLIEQLVNIEFEILSVSYIISELFLLGLHMVMAENERLKAQLCQQQAEAEPRMEIAVQDDVPAEELEPQKKSAPECPSVHCQQFIAGLASLTKTERAIYQRYIAGKTTKEIMAELCIKENTLKFHNKNLYGKLGVSSRKQLLEIYKQLEGITQE